MNSEQPDEVNITALIQISDESLQAIATIATEKFSKDLYYD